MLEFKYLFMNIMQHLNYVNRWNDTVANLTLMALGSSSPEILLSIIEICGNNFLAGDLGPGTIVGKLRFLNIRKRTKINFQQLIKVRPHSTYFAYQLYVLFQSMLVKLVESKISKVFFIKKLKLKSRKAYG